MQRTAVVLPVFLSGIVFLPTPGLAQDKCAGVYGTGATRFSLATGSPGELRLLKLLGEAFGKRADATLCWVKAGSGESLQLLKEKNVDMIMVHAPDAETKHCPKAGQRTAA